MEQNNLAETNNFLHDPGRHTTLSPVVGIDSQAQAALDKLNAKMPVVKVFEDAVYDARNIYLIPSAKEKEARALSMKIFEAAVAEFKSDGLTTKNAVAFSDGGRAGVAYVYDTENEWNTWTVHVIVKKSSHKDGKYLPVGVVAVHELMHVRQTVKGISEKEHNARKEKHPVELVPALQTIVQVDAIYKQAHGHKIDSVQTYRNIEWNGHSLSLGELANFYRALFERDISPYKAVQSEESLELMKTGQLPTIK